MACHSAAECLPSVATEETRPLLTSVSIGQHKRATLLSSQHDQPTKKRTPWSIVSTGWLLLLMVFLLLLVVILSTRTFTSISLSSVSSINYKGRSGSSGRILSYHYLQLNAHRRWLGDDNRGEDRGTYSSWQAEKEAEYNRACDEFWHDNNYTLPPVSIMDGNGGGGGGNGGGKVRQRYVLSFIRNVKVFASLSG